MYTYEQFIAAIEAAVTERGEGFRYKDAYAEHYAKVGGCEYTIDGEGACIIGKAIHILTGEPYDGFNGPADEALIGGRFRTLSGGLRRAAVDAQRVQDDNRTLGEALKQLRTTYEKYVNPEDCDHPEDSLIWSSGEPWVVITLNPYDVKCGVCGEIATMRDEL